jgi:hypothetical protein
MLDNFKNFYGIIFNGQITSISILLPITFIFIQLTNKEYTSSFFNKIFKDNNFRLYLLFSSIIIFVSGIGTYLLTIKDYNFFSFVNFNSIAILTSEKFGLFLVMLFLVNFIPFFRFIISNLKSIDPSIYISSYLDNLSSKEVEIYLLNNYGIPKNIDLSNISFSLQELMSNENNFKDNKENNNDKLSKIKRDRKKIKKEIEEEYKDILDVIKNILNHNLTNSNINDFKSSIFSLINNYSILYHKLDDLKHEEHLKKALTKEYIQIFKFLYEDSQNLSKSQFSALIIKGIKELINNIIELEDYYNLTNAFATLENFIVFQNKNNYSSVENITEIFSEDAIKIYKSNIDQEYRENLLRIYTRVSERIINKFSLKKQPIMMGIENEYIYDNIFETHYNFFKITRDIYTDEYPLILLDTNYCIFKAVYNRLNSAHSEYENNYLREKTHSFFYEVELLFEEFVKKENIKGACLCVFRITDLFDILYKNDEYNLMKENIDTLIYMGYRAASQDKEFKTLFLDEGIENYVLKKLHNYKGLINNIDEEVNEINLRSHSNLVDLNRSDAFLFDLAELYESNFNMNFTWENREWN